VLYRRRCRRKRLDVKVGGKEHKTPATREGKKGGPPYLLLGKEKELGSR